MKPLLLELQAFGPFAGRQAIDFRELGSKTFFLIHGPTGAGKTSLLDGLCFALFGDSSGGERDGRQMRSHHADAATLTEVRFGFALGDAVYRVRRVPEQMRKARRGGGETKQSPIAELCRVDRVDGSEVEHPLAAGWGKVTEAVVGLLGFESAQFRQVIVLPQGRFFEVLKSSSQEREKILQTLFGTELYKRIEEQLKLAAADLARQAERVRTQRQALLDQAGAEHEAALDARRQAQAEALAVRRDAEREADAAARTAEAGLADARRAADRFDELDTAGRKLESLRGEATDRAAERTRLADAQRATLIEPHAAAVVELERQADAASARARSLAEQLAAARSTAAAADAAWQRERLRTPEIDAAVARIAELDALVEKVAALATARRGHAEAAASAGAAAAAHATALQAQRAAVAALQLHHARRQEAQVQAAGLDGLAVRHARLVERLAQRTALDACADELNAAARRLEADRHRLAVADARGDDARARLDRVRRDWIAGQAARLAHELAAGAPCPVCGSADHPRPATATGPLVVDAALRDAEAAVAGAEAGHREAARQLAAAQHAASLVEARIEALRTALGEVLPPLEALQSESAAANTALGAARAAARSAATLEADGPAAQRAAENAEAAAARTDAAVQAAQAGLQRLEGQLAERAAGIAAEWTDPAALDTARGAAIARRDALRRSLDDAATAASRASHRLTGLAAQAASDETARLQLAERLAAGRADLEARLATAGFAELAAFAKARLDPAAAAALASRLAAFGEALAAATERHTRAAEATQGLVRPDMPAAGARHETAKAALRDAGNAVRDALAALEATTGFVASLARLLADHRAIESRYTVLREVADVAGGANPQRMSFQRYVLATLLEEVLVATTLRLQVMSRGRYEIRRKSQASDQRAAAGLDLEVFDQYTGTTRGVATLSGGESFLASLALALGLSDVVQSYAGGIRLDAIFVDEGFGTLDPESLDFALRALQDLQQAGRLIGIISHVAELKERIDARLELTATPRGSVAAFRL